MNLDLYPLVVASQRSWALRPDKADANDQNALCVHIENRWGFESYTNDESMERTLGDDGTRVVLVRSAYQSRVP